MNHRTHTTAPRVLALIAASLIALTGCAPAAAPTAEPKPAVAGDSVTVSDAWVKAAPEGMTAAFGTLSNPTGHDIIVVSATTEAAASAQLHETVADDAGKMTMRQVEGGFTIPASGSLDLEPGANHLMLMGLTEPVQAGEEIAFTLTFSDDSTMSFSAPVKDYSGAQEEYSDHDMPESEGHK
ncbi:copper chaperone PCu(A)C [Microbacterium sp. H1-D42]|uniref:copper chaperone PCu(A)C n=1 Tax=Microbacterium sp. H1-D42 TaxID=2925844 RepID=UPI001F535C63|nr:copper chaperone PCu(A)C [Microbacterium sp. H1-D42]UNK70029.1 copper chaperone PCu(A)C [Microbacterium sp. H1-D42]